MYTSLRGVSASRRLTSACTRATPASLAATLFGESGLEVVDQELRSASAGLERLQTALQEPGSEMAVRVSPRIETVRVRHLHGEEPEIGLRRQRPEQTLAVTGVGEDGDRRHPTTTIILAKHVANGRDAVHRAVGQGRHNAEIDLGRGVQLEGTQCREADGGVDDVRPETAEHVSVEVGERAGLGVDIESARRFRLPAGLDDIQELRQLLNVIEVGVGQEHVPDGLLRGHRQPRRDGAGIHGDRVVEDEGGRN